MLLRSLLLCRKRSAKRLICNSCSPKVDYVFIAVDFPSVLGKYVSSTLKWTISFCSNCVFPKSFPKNLIQIQVIWVKVKKQRPLGSSGIRWAINTRLKWVQSVTFADSDLILVDMPWLTTSRPHSCQPFWTPLSGLPVLCIARCDHKWNIFPEMTRTA